MNKNGQQFFCWVPGDSTQLAQHDGGHTGGYDGRRRDQDPRRVSGQVSAGVLVDEPWGGQGVCSEAS